MMIGVFKKSNIGFMITYECIFTNDFLIRKIFYKFLNKISDTKLTMNTTGSGIFDKSVIEKLKKINQFRQNQIKSKK